MTFRAGVSIAGCVKATLADLGGISASSGVNSSFFGRSCFLWLFRLGAAGVGVASVIVGGCAVVAGVVDDVAASSVSDVAAGGTIV